MDRFRTDPVELSDFVSRVLAECPRCGGRAIVVAAGPSGSGAPRLTCGECGFVAEREGDAGCVLGRPVDPFFGYPLWLRTPCCGEELWALGPEHLAWLRAHVAAGLRETNDGTDRGRANRQLASRLPAWMLSAKHRAQVQSAIARLEERLDERR